MGRPNGCKSRRCNPRSDIGRLSPSQGRGSRRLEQQRSGLPRMSCLAPHLCEPVSVERLVAKFDARRDLERLQPAPAVAPDALEHLLDRLWVAEHDSGRHYLSRDWIGPPDNRHVTDVINLMQHALDLCGIYLFTAHVDDLGLPPEDA